MDCGKNFGYVSFFAMVLCHWQKSVQSETLFHNSLYILLFSKGSITALLEIFIVGGIFLLFLEVTEVTIGQRC